MNINWKAIAKVGVIGIGFVATAAKEIMAKNENDAKMKEFAAEAVKEALANQVKES